MNPHRTPRPILALVLLLTVPILLGATLAPHAFNGLRALGEHTDALGKLTEARFERVTSRIVMIITALLLVPVVRLTGLWPSVRAGLAASPERWRALAASLVLGLASMAAVFALGWFNDAFVVSPKFTGWMSFSGYFLAFLAGAAFIGLFEEIFFRGIVFGALRTQLAFPLAAFLSSLFFSAIHFFRPLYPAVIEHASWYTGFAIIPHMFDRFVFEHDVWFALTLFMMGLTLSLHYERRGHLYTIIGLHAGWVLAMRTGAQLFDRNHEVFPVFIGRSDTLTKGLLALVVITVFFLAECRRAHRDRGNDRLSG
jgi:membrane protease YdiL (CAAX protease family)